MGGGGRAGGIFPAGRLAVSQRKSGGNSIHRSSWDRNTRDNYLRSLLQILISRNPFLPLAPPPYANGRGIFSAGRRGVKKIFARHSPCLCFSRRCIKFRVAGRLACKLHLYFILFCLVFKSTRSFRSLEPAGLDTNITVIEKYYRRHLRWNYCLTRSCFLSFLFFFFFFFLLRIGTRMRVPQVDESVHAVHDKSLRRTCQNYIGEWNFSSKARETFLIFISCIVCLRMIGI